MTHPSRLPLPTPSDSRALWKRATELDQALRTSRRTTPPPSSGGVEDSGLPVSELLAVAREVGISPDSVLLSLAEERLPDGGELRPRGSSPLWHQLLVETVEATELSLHLPLPPVGAQSLLDRVLARPEYRMIPEDRIQAAGAGEPGAAAQVVHRSGVDAGLGPRHGPRVGSDPRATAYRPGETAGWGGGAGFHGAMQVADGRVLLASVVPHGEGGSRIRLRMPAYERGMNLALSAGAGGLGGLGGVSAGAALGQSAVGMLLAGAAGLVPLVGVVAPAILGGYVGVAVGILGFRSLQKWGLRKGDEALQRLARLLEMEATQPSPPVGEG